VARWRRPGPAARRGKAAARALAGQGARGVAPGHTRGGGAQGKGGGGLRRRAMAWPLRPAQGQAAAACGRASTSAAVRCRRVQWRGPMPRGHGPQRAASGGSAATGGAATFQRRRCGIRAGKRTGRWSKGRGSSLRPSIGPRKGGGWTSTRGGGARVRVNGGRWLRARFRPGNDEIGLGKWLRRCGVG